jgi:hypothetical protein
MSMYVRAQDIEALKRNMRGYLNEVSGPKIRQWILSAGAVPVVSKVRRGGFFKNSKKPHFYYSKQGRIKIVPRNLRRSMHSFKTKVGSVEIGPKVLRKIAGKYDTIGEKSATSSGFYAAALFKKAANFRQQVTEKALMATISKIDERMEKALSKLHKRWKKKYNL